MPLITVKTADGLVNGIFDAPEAANLMRFFVEEGVDGIDGDCSGCMSCGTCLIQLDPGQMGLLPPATAEERDALDALCGKSPDEGYRLSCQIDAPAGLADLTVTIREEDDVF